MIWKLIADGLTRPGWSGLPILIFMLIIEGMATLIGGTVFLWLMGEQRNLIDWKAVYCAMAVSMFLSWIMGLILWGWYQSLTWLP